MEIDEWWPKLDPSAQQWLIANNGDAVSAEILGQIAAVGGEVTPEADRTFFFSDEETDWIEAIANDEGAAE
ncbi:hypothetical protein ACVXZ4_00160 [Lacisediminihabitans sp. FW035]